MLVVSLAVLMCGQFADLDPTEALRVIDGLHGDIEALELVYEGRVEYLTGGAVELAGQFQGTYTYRDDGSARIDYFRWREGPENYLVHGQMALRGDRLLTRSDAPDASPFPGRIETETGSGGSLNTSCSPHRFICYWYFAANSGIPWRDAITLGWHEIASQPCLKIRGPLTPGNPRSTLTLWVDLERGGHPLRVEIHDQDRLVSSDVDIRLARFIEDGIERWLPVHGVHESYWDGSRFSRAPIVRETYDVVRRTVRFKERPTDRVFTLVGRPPVFDDPDLRRLRQAVEARFSEPGPVAPPRTDPEAVRRQLDERLAEADRQAEMIAASSAARRDWGPGRVAQLVFAAIGGAAVIGGGLLWRKR